MTAAEDTTTTIPARTERQAMDWSLVLASQGIGVELDREGQGRWLLRVERADHDRAQDAILRFRQENRAFEWHRELPGSDFQFDGRAVLWALAIVLVYAVQDRLARGLFDTRAVVQGEWWRAFSAVWLHQDTAHLASNVTLGIVFLGLAMARFGAGVALLATFLCGGLANFTGLLLRPEPYIGLGASGMIMGALGMIAAQSIPLWRTGRRGTRLMLAGLGAGALVFIQTGTNPGSDVLVHLAGFVFGILFGALSPLIPEDQHRKVEVITLTAYIILLLTIFALVGSLSVC